MAMLLLKGFATGLAMVAPLGPIALALVGLGVERGRRHALEGALGVTLADGLLMGITAILAATVGLFDLPGIDLITVGLGVVLIAIGARIALRAESALEAVGAIRRPGPTLLLMTLVNPLSVALWLAVVASLPSHQLTPARLAEFGVGVTLASLVWHTGLGTGAAWVGSRIGPATRRWSGIAGGIVVMGIGVMLVV